MAEKKEERELAIPPHPAWIELAREAHKKGGLSLRELGEKLDNAYGKTNLGRFFSEGYATVPMAQAIAAFYKLPDPFIAVADEVDLRWIQIGRSLRSLAPDDFREILEDAAEVASLKNKSSQGKQRIKSKKLPGRSDPRAKH